MNQDDHSSTLDFFRQGGSQLSSQEATILLQHLAECEGCAKLMADHELKAQQLLESISPSGSWTPEAKEAVALVQNELLCFADAVLKHISPVTAEVKAALEAQLPTAAGEELWALGADVQPMRFRIALACSEVATALQSFLALGRRRRVNAVLRRSGLTLIGAIQKTVPADYFAARISSYADLATDLALTVWNGLVDVTIEGKIGLPGIVADATSYRKGEVTIALAEG